MAVLELHLCAAVVGSQIQVPPNPSLGLMQCTPSSFLSFKRNIKAEVLYYMKLADIKGLLINLTPLSTVLKVRTLQLRIDLVADVF